MCYNQTCVLVYDDHDIVENQILHRALQETLLEITTKMHWKAHKRALVCCIREIKYTNTSLKILVLSIYYL